MNRLVKIPGACYFEDFEVHHADASIIAGSAVAVVGARIKLREGKEFYYHKVYFTEREHYIASTASVDEIMQAVNGPAKAIPEHVLTYARQVVTYPNNYTVSNIDVCRWILSIAEGGES